MVLLKILSYALIFSVACSGTVVWILERREKKYGLGGISMSDAFLAAAAFLIFVYLSTLVVLLRWPGYGGTFSVLVITALAGFCLYRESIYKLQQRKLDHRDQAEVRLMLTHIAKDPGNSAYFMRLSELYEKLGNKKQAIEAAEMVFKLEPTERNRFRLKHLEED